MKSFLSKVIAVLAMVLVLGQSGTAMAQQYQIVNMDATTHGTTVSTPVVVLDDNSQGGLYQHGVDYTLTITSNCQAPVRMALHIDSMDIGCLDTLYVYDGPSTAGTVIAKINNFSEYEEGDNIFVLPGNMSNTMTLRFRTNPLTDTNYTNRPCFRNNPRNNFGFRVSFNCETPCEKVVPVISDEFYRTRNGVIYDTARAWEVLEYDTVYTDSLMTDIDHIDTNTFMGIHLCIGDGVIFKGHGEYTHRYGYYNPSDATTYFRWDLGYENDTIVGTGMTEISYSDYQTTGCFDITLNLIDVYGCRNTVIPSFRVRTSPNPIKTIFTLADICNSDSLMVNMGYGDADATLQLRRILQDSSVSKTNNIRTFIPDGPNCTALGAYYEAPVEFSEFPNNRYVTSHEDICSLCINMEHTFLGDMFISLICPTGQESFMILGNQHTQTQPPITMDESIPGASQGGGVDLGYPTSIGSSPLCDSLMQPYGIGLDYCFSRDIHYTLVTGELAGSVWSSTNHNPAGNFYLTSQGFQESGNLQQVIPSGFYRAGDTISVGGSHKKPSNHDEKTDYYLPFSTFSELVGCPLNGIWKVRVYDVWGQDNGWIFNWNLDMCNVSQNNCKYQVDVDSLVWMPDPSPQYHDYDMGHYRGLTSTATEPTISYLKTTDTAGTFPLIVRIYDHFGCVWDTATRITSYWSPRPDLGPDTSLCGVATMKLDASDAHSATQNYTYIWAPFGQNTDTITTQEGSYGDVDYVVEVTNKVREKACVTRDTIHVASRRQPIPSFIPTPFDFEGCAPYTISFDNRSTDAAEHLWDFGDGITTTEASPTHTYAAGLYDLKYYAISADGCIDSVVNLQSVAVFPAPTAGFSWTPTYPSVLNPVASFTNLTDPQTPWTNYFWEIQYNVANPLSVETLTDVNPTFDFSQWTDDDPSGNYAVRLIARTDNLAPSGNMIYCRDTAENSILVVNDYLQFPNVVTPNGDGINDRFVIMNLVNGMGYPINQLDIYNKWGAHVYHKENISRDEDFWDPQNMPAGTYFYRFSARGYNGNIEHNGAIEVVK